MRKGNSVTELAYSRSEAVRPDQVAEMLAISRAKVYELLGAGALPSFKIGRVRLILVTDVHDYLRRLRDSAGQVAASPQRVSGD
jgi:excisionase family DNA binding protein